MSAISVILLAIIFCIIQISLLKKGNRKWMKYLPTAIGGIGVVVGIAIYHISYIPFLLELHSQSVLSENQYLGLTVCIFFLRCLVGALLGIVMKKFLGKKQFINIELPLGISIIGFFVGCGIGIYRKSCLKK